MVKTKRQAFIPIHKCPPDYFVGKGSKLSCVCYKKRGGKERETLPTSVWENKSANACEDTKTSNNFYNLVGSNCVSSKTRKQARNAHKIFSLLNSIYRFKTTV